MKIRINWPLLFADAPARKVLVRGVDYSCGQAAACQSIRNAARARGLYVSLVDAGDRVVVWTRTRPVKDIRAEQTCSS